MPFPWPSFGGFRFLGVNERPIFRTDRGWNISITTSRQRPLGTATDSIVTLAIGSASRSFELYLTPARFATLQALVNTTALFTDWDRPDPDSRQAFLASVMQLDRTPVKVCDSNGNPTRFPNRVRARVELISQ